MQWIKITEKLPRDHDWIIGATSERMKFGVWFEEEKEFVLPDDCYISMDITHWMPLPPFPED